MSIRSRQIVTAPRPRGHGCVAHHSQHGVTSDHTQLAKRIKSALAHHAKSFMFGNDRYVLRDGKFVAWWEK